MAPFNLLNLLGLAGGNRNMLQNVSANAGGVPPLDPAVNVGPSPVVASPNMLSAVAGPAPQAVPMQEVAAGGGRPSDFSFLTPDRKQFLQDMFIGWAAGATPQQSLSLGAAQAAKGSGQRKDQNQTLDWLKGRGVSESDARMLANSPGALNEYVQSIYQTPKQKPPIEVNGQLVDPNTYKVIGDFRSPEKEGDKDTALIRELKAAGLREGTPEFQEAILANNRPKGMMIESDGQGGFKMVQGTDVSGGANMNVEQGKNTGFLLRAQDADRVIDGLESEGTSIWNNTAGQIPLVGNYLRGDNAQKFDQAKRDFINAQLRQESGAVISPEEFKNAEVQYFPQPGDSDAVIEQKRQNRENAISGFRIRSGPGAQSVDKMDGGTPQVGMVQDGYRFKGGDPSNPANWEKQ